MARTVVALPSIYVPGMEKVNEEKARKEILPLEQSC